MSLVAPRRPSPSRRLLAAALLLLAFPLAANASPETTFARHTAASKTTVDHTIWDRQTKAYIAPDPTGLNRVDYKRWKAEGHKDLKAYVAALQKIDPGTLARPEQFAFWSNLYNARTIDIVLDKYPVKSIRDISLGGGLKSLVTGGPWQAEVVKVSGLGLSLDDIEHKILRAIFKDPRVHYALNCASIGCPNLQAGAFTGANLDANLDAGARAFINHPRGIAVEAGKVKASNIFSWFETDFGGSAAAVLEHVRKYAAPALKDKLASFTTIAAYDYDWRLNDVAK